MKSFKEVLNEDREFSLNDFPIGTEVYMADEVWVVVKPGSRGGKVIMAPFNQEAKKRYISMGIDFDLNWLNGAVTKIEKK